MLGVNVPSTHEWFHSTKPLLFFFSSLIFFQFFQFINN